MNRLIPFFLVFCGFFASFAPYNATFAITDLPNYTSGSVFRFGDVFLTDNETKSVENAIKNYENKTGNQIGFMLTEDFSEYAQTWRGFINQMPQKGYAPAGWLIMLDFSTRQIHVLHDNALTYANVWTEDETESLIEDVIAKALQNDGVKAALLDSVDYIEEQVPQSVAYLTESQAQSDQTRAAASGFATRQGILIFLGVVFLLLGLYFGRLVLRKWKKKRHLAQITQYFNTILPLHSQDLDFIRQKVTNDELLGIIDDYKADLEAIKPQLVAFMEEKTKELDETNSMAQKTETLEDEITRLVHHYADYEQQLADLESQKNEKTAWINETFNRVNL